jgi:hypothetical protein
MDGLRGLTVCVGFDDMLALTLRHNVKHFCDYVVVTSPDDTRTARVVADVEGVRLHRTDAFTRDGAEFNKGLAIEEGFDVLGRSGWILYTDADIVLPGSFEPGELDREVLYGMSRRIVPGGVTDVDPAGDWSRWEPLPSGSLVFGYFQLFHAKAAVLQDRPWYPIHHGSAGFSDCGFNDKFPVWKVLDGYVLHIGDTGENWFGRATPRLDGEPVPDADKKLLRMGELFLELGWDWARPDLQALALAARAAVR